MIDACKSFDWIWCSNTTHALPMCKLFDKFLSQPSTTLECCQVASLACATHVTRPSCCWCNDYVVLVDNTVLLQQWQQQRHRHHGQDYSTTAATIYSLLGALVQCRHCHWRRLPMNHKEWRHCWSSMALSLWRECATFASLHTLITANPYPPKNKQSPLLLLCASAALSHWLFAP